jgi:hypothetical protein
MRKRLLYIFFVCCAPLLAKSQVTINPGLSWKDNSGNVIQAHGGGVLKVGKIFYWYGEDRSDNKSSQRINCYSSADLKNWTFRKVVLSSSTPGMAQANLERPKVLYNDKTKKYVMWVHKENTHDYGEAKALVAVCNTPDGDFTFVKEFRPFGNMSRDCNLFKDDDGNAYFVSTARENTDMMCYRLTADYLDAAEQKKILDGGRREAPIIFKRDGVYYLCTSAATSWAPNYNTVQRAKNILGPYGPQQPLYSNTTWNSYDSQTASVLDVNGTLVMIADRWKGWDLKDSRYMWLPINFDSKGSLVPIEWADSWTIDPVTGSATAPARLGPASNNIALNKIAEASVANDRNGNEARCAFDGNPNTKWCADNGDWPHWLMIDLGRSYKISSSEITWERNNRTAYQYIIESSLDKNTWTMVADKSKNTNGDQKQVDNAVASGRYFRVRAVGHIDVKGSYSWASLFEWKLVSEGVNVALNKTATADSQQAGTYAAKANDGEFGSTWSTGNGKLGNSWGVDLGKSYNLRGCRVIWQDPGFYYQYKIEVSLDKRNWTTVVDKTNTDVVWAPVHKFNASQVRYLRITVNGMDDGCWLGIREVEVFNTTMLPLQPATIKIAGGK